MEAFGFQTFYYRGERIEDIEAWAKERGYKMLTYKQTRRIPNMFSGKIVEEVSYHRVPEIFYNTMHSEGDVITEVIDEKQL